jgi:hypothetical protein
MSTKTYEFHKLWWSRKPKLAGGGVTGPPNPYSLAARRSNP